MSCGRPGRSGEIKVMSKHGLVPAQLKSSEVVSAETIIMCDLRLMDNESMLPDMQVRRRCVPKKLTQLGLCELKAPNPVHRSALCTLGANHLNQ
jgi:hypothetical protein